MFNLHSTFRYADADWGSPIPLLTSHRYWPVSSELTGLITREPSRRMVTLVSKDDNSLTGAPSLNHFTVTFPGWALASQLNWTYGKHIKLMVEHILILILDLFQILPVLLAQNFNPMIVTRIVETILVVYGQISKIKTDDMSLFSVLGLWRSYFEIKFRMNNTTF